MAVVRHGRGSGIAASIIAREAGRAVGRFFQRRRAARVKQEDQKMGDGTGAESSGKAVTSFHDVVRTYRSRRLRRKTLKRMRRNYKRYLNNVTQAQAPQKIVFTGNKVVSGSAGAQGLGIIPGLFTGFGSTGWRDMNAILTANAKDGSNLNHAPTIGGSLANKIYVKSGLMEMDITNTGSTACIVEIFECIVRKNTSNDSTFPQIGTPGNFLVSDYADESALTNVSQYYTPFDDTSFVRNHRILNCKKVYLAAGAATDIMIRSRGFLYDPAKVVGYAVPGRSRFWVMCVTGSPQNNAGAPNFSASQLSCVYQRTYTFNQVGGLFASATASTA